MLIAQNLRDVPDAAMQWHIDMKSIDQFIPDQRYLIRDAVYWCRAVHFDSWKNPLGTVADVFDRLGNGVLMVRWPS